METPTNCSGLHLWAIGMIKRGAGISYFKVALADSNNM